MKRKILITGASGFLGRYLVNKLLAENVTLIILTRSNCEQSKLANKGCRFIIGDLLKMTYSDWQHHLQGIDTVVHLAWYVEPGQYLHALQNIDYLNASCLLARAAVENGVKHIVGMGTCLEYAASKERLTSQAPLDPKSLYASAKASLFFMIKSLTTQYDVLFSWCRLFYIYGEGEPKEKLVSSVRERLRNQKEVILNTPYNKVDFINVEQASLMISDIIINRITGPLNICSGTGLTIEDMAKSIAQEERVSIRYILVSEQKEYREHIAIIGVPYYEES